MADLQSSSSSWRKSWKSLDRAARLALGTAIAVVTAALIGVAVWALRPSYQVLFAQLNEGDAAVIVEELKRAKEPYRLANGGTTIEVPAERVHETRLSLMAGGAPLAGGVGFEIFDRQGLGATEQSQRVSYQRAVQGELARTISALEGVQQARVHIVMPESTLFRRDRQEPRAAVTLVLKPNGTLAREQVAGIQRLVAASVAGLSPARVVVADQRGVTLSGVDAFVDVGGRSDGSAGAGVGEARLAMKRQVEDYITRKIVELLDRTFGPGQAMVTVDASLNFDEVRRTIQDRGPSPGDAAAVVRRRQMQAATPGAAENAWTLDAMSELEGLRTTSTSDVEYEYVRRIEQVVAAPGGVTRLSVGVVVPGTLDADRRTQITSLVRMAAGLDPRRGDALVVEGWSRDSASATEPAVSDAATDSTASAENGPTAVGPSAATAQAARGATAPVVPLHHFGWMLFGTLVILAGLAALVWRTRHTSARIPVAERERLLADLERALAPATAPAAPRPEPARGNR